MDTPSKIPWVKIHEYLLEVEVAETMADFRTRSMSALERVIPCDAGMTFCDVAGTAGCVEAHGFDARFAYKYNSHYGPVAPYDWRQVCITQGVADFRTYRGSEFVDDFVKPEGVGYKVCKFFPGAKVAVGLMYSWTPRQFDYEVDAMALINQHLDLLFRRIERAESAGTGLSWCTDRVSGEQAEFWRLSRREIEVLNLILCGYTSRQIALRLFIDTRTVESHVGHIFLKTGVNRRKDLVAMMTGTPQRAAL